MQLLPQPSGHGNVGAGLNGDVVSDREQFQRPSEFRIVGAVYVLTHGCTELPQCEGHEWCAAKHGAQGANY